MKTKMLIFILAAMFLGLSSSFAQNYPSFSQDSYIIKVKYKGQRPTIVDFVNTYLSNPEDEYIGGLSELWKRKWAGRAQLEGDKVTVDTRNGYVKFEDYSESYDSTQTLSLTEFCYWNCSDGKHKVVAMSNSLFYGGKYVAGQYTGTSFFLYENATRRMMLISSEDLGIDYEPNNYSTGFDGKDWFVEKDGKKTTMTQEEYEQWIEDNIPVVLFHLPRQGKNIVVEYWTPKKSVKKVLEWDGLRFNKPE